MEISPCPFCDSEDISCYKDYLFMYIVKCNQCGAHGEPHYTLDYAIKYWNDRADEISDIDIELRSIEDADQIYQSQL